MATDTASPRSASDPTRNLWQWPMFLAGIGVFCAAWQGVIAFGPPNAADAYERSLQSLRAAAEATSPDPASLKSLLNATESESGRFLQHAPLTNYLVGSAYVRLADLTGDPAQARDYSLRAVDHLDRVVPDRLTNPDEDGPRLVFRKAKAQAGAGKFAGVTEADLTLATKALTFPPPGEHNGEAFRYAGDLFLAFSPPAYKDAKKALDRYLKTAVLATPSASLARGKMKLAEVYLATNEVDAAREWLTQISPDSPADVLMPARVHLARMHMKESNWVEAAKLWEQVRGSSPLPAGLPAQAGYHLAVCQQETGQPEVAAKLYEEVSKSDGPEKFASLVKLTDLSLQGRDAEARSSVVNRLADALTGLPPGEFANPHVTIHELRGTIEKAIQVLPAEGVFDAPIRLTESYARVAVPGREREKKAEVLAAWGEALRKQNGNATPKFLAAAKEYLDLAAVANVPGPVQAERLHRAARYFQAAGDRTAKVGALEKLVQIPDVPEEIIGPAWLDYAEVLLELNKPDEALDKFRKAINSPVVGMAARYKLARLLLDSNDPARQPFGMELLRQIGGSQVKNPSENEYHERALLELGQDALKAGHFTEAESSFRKQVSFHPEGTEANLGRFLLGVSLLQQTTRAPGGPERADDVKMRKEALDFFRSIVTDIDTRRSKTSHIAERDLWLRTQSSLRVLQALQQMERLGEVIATASVVRRDCEGKVEELIALSMMYHAQKQSNHPELAMRVLDEMRDVYRVLPDAAFHGPGEYSKDYWERVWFNPPAEPMTTPSSSAPAPTAPSPAPMPLVPIGGSVSPERPQPLVPIPMAPEPAGLPALPRVP